MTEQTREKLRSAFTVEDRNKIQEMVDAGNARHIAAELSMETKAQEEALQDLITEMFPPVNPEGSSVRAELERRLAAGEEVIQSPEDEAEWQAKLDAEKAGEVVEIKIEEKVLTKPQIIVELEKLQVEFDPSAKKADLKALLEVALS